jgi:putative oxidoreductase
MTVATFSTLKTPRGNSTRKTLRAAPGGHFHIGYVWALPEGGYEFGVFWAAVIAVFAVLGGGRNSADWQLWQSEPARRLLPSVVWKVLAC